MKKNFFGPHWHLDAKGVDPKLIVDKNLMESFAHSAVETANMRVIDGPHVIYYEHPDADIEGGCSLSLILVDSHMTLHSFINDGWVFCDLFSCQEFDSLVLNKLFVDTFAPEADTYRVDYRGEGYKRDENT